MSAETLRVGGDPDPANRYAPGRESAVVVSPALMDDRSSAVSNRITAPPAGAPVAANTTRPSTTVSVSSSVRGSFTGTSTSWNDCITSCAGDTTSTRQSSRSGNAPRNHPSSAILKNNSGDAPRPPKNT